MKITKNDVLKATGSLQVCVGHKSGSEAAIHPMHDIFKVEETEGILLIDADNAFNSINRKLCFVIFLGTVQYFRLILITAIVHLQIYTLPEDQK